MLRCGAQKTRGSPCARKGFGICRLAGLGGMG